MFLANLIIARMFQIVKPDVRGLRLPDDLGLTGRRNGIVYLREKSGVRFYLTPLVSLSTLGMLWKKDA